MFNLPTILSSSMVTPTKAHGLMETGFYGAWKTVIKPYMTGVCKGHKDWTVQTFSDKGFNSNLD